MIDGAAMYREEYRRGWRPDVRLSVTEWADRHRILSSASGQTPVRWRTSTTPYLREIMDNLGPRSPYRRVVFMKGSQIGGTEAGNNWLGFIMQHCPAATLILRPTIEEARRFSRQRIDTMIDATPELAEVVRAAQRSRRGNSVALKEFTGGQLFLVGAKKASAVKSMPIRWLFCDEIDEYPGDIDGQGDPVALAEKRTAGPSYRRRKIFLVSTPTVKGVSRIEAAFEASDQRRYFVPCPHCGAFDFIRWHNLRWINDDPDTAALLCEGCGVLIEEHHKRQMLPAGEWRPTAPAARETVGYHLSALYSPLGWLPWSACVNEFVEAKGNPNKLKTWVNSVLGESWEERGKQADPEGLLARIEAYPASPSNPAIACEVPAGVGVLVASVDTQDDRLEVQVKGYGAGEESWLVAYGALYGDPGLDDLWLELDLILQRTFEHEHGRQVPISCTTVDSGGHHTEQVYKFCKAREGRRVFAIKGGTEKGKPVVARPTTHNRYRAKLFTFCVDTAKEIIIGRLRIEQPGPGFCHLPSFADSEYCAQLASEKAVRRYKKGTSVREWVKLRERNEALDLEVYCLGALYILGPELVRTLPERAKRLAAPPGDDEAVGPNRKAAPARAGRSSYMSGWRGV